MKPKCKSGKIILDKKSAVTMANLTLKLHHIKMNIYQCEDHWHLATADDPKFGVSHHKKFRHNL